VQGARPPASPLFAQMKQAVTTIVMFSNALRQSRPEAAQDFDQARQLIVSGFKKILGQNNQASAPPTGVQAPAVPQSGTIPPPIPGGGETPEATL